MASDRILDRRGPGWFWADNAIIDTYGPRIGAYGVAVYAALARYANQDGECYPAIPTIAKQLAISERTVQRTIQTLVEVGLLTVQANRIESKAGKPLNRPNTYTLLRVGGVPGSHHPSGGVVSHSHQGGVPQSPPLVSHSHHPGVTQSPKQDSLNKTYGNKTQEESLRAPHAELSSASLQDESVSTLANSNPTEEKKGGRPRDELFEELTRICGADIPSLTDPERARFNKACHALRKVQATPEQVKGFERWWSKVDWRGKQGQYPEPEQVVKNWSRARNEDPAVMERYQRERMPSDLYPIFGPRQLGAAIERWQIATPLERRQYEQHWRATGGL